MAIWKSYVIEVTQYSVINTPISTFDFPYDKVPTEADIEDRITEIGFQHGSYNTVATVKEVYRLTKKTVIKH